MCRWTPKRWQQAQHILDLLDDLPPIQHPACLDRHCLDLDLRRDIERAMRNRERIDTLVETPLVQIPLHLPPPSRIGPYRLLRELGRGGMGVVYLAQQEEPFQRQVAIKLIHPQAYNEQTVRRFEDERQILARMEHPNVVQLFDGGTTDDGQPYFVMEHVEGESLNTWCDRHPSVPERLRLFQQVCSAVQLAHQKLRIVHRDLKPGNILVTPDGTAKLLDFGIAKDLDAQNLPGLPQASAWTPLFTSPEQLAGEPPSTRSDIYSLGVLLYRVLSGRLPYDVSGLGLEAVRRELLASEPSPLAADVELDAIVHRALLRDPGRRYSSVEQLADDLRRYVAGQPVTALPSTWFYSGRKFLQRHRWRVAAAGIILVLSGGLVVDQVRGAMQVRQVSASLVDLLRALQPSTPDQQAQLGQALQRAAVVVDAPMFARQPLDQALLLDHLGRAHLSLGHIEEAADFLQQGLDIRRRILGDQHVLVAESMQNIASADRRRGRSEEAREQLDAALQIATRHGETQLLSGILNNLTVLLHDRGEMEEASALAQQVLDLKQGRPGADPVDLITPRGNLASILLSQGQPRLAEALYRQNLEVRVELLGPDHKDVASTRNQLAIALYDQGQLHEAEELARRALETRRAIYGPTHRQIGSVLNSLGRILHARDQTVEAEEVYREALEHLEGASDAVRLHGAVVRRNLAALLVDGQRFQDAERLSRDALDQLMDVRPAGNWRVHDARSVLGRALDGQGRWLEARPMLQTSYQGLAETRGPKAAVTCEAARRLVEADARGVLLDEPVGSPAEIN